MAKLFLLNLFIFVPLALFACGSSTPLVETLESEPTCVGIPAELPANAEWTGSGPESPVLLCLSIDDQKVELNQFPKFLATITNQTDRVVPLGGIFINGFPQETPKIWLSISMQGDSLEIARLKNGGSAEISTDLSLTYEWQPSERKEVPISWNLRDDFRTAVAPGVYEVIAMMEVSWDDSSADASGRPMRFFAKTPSVEVVVSE